MNVKRCSDSSEAFNIENREVDTKANFEKTMRELEKNAWFKGPRQYRSDSAEAFDMECV